MQLMRDAAGEKDLIQPCLPIKEIICTLIGNSVNTVAQEHNGYS